MPRLSRIFICVLFVFLPWTVSAPKALELPISASVQQTPVWCWAAVGEMTLRYFGVPNLSPVGNYQCAVVAALGGVCFNSCAACVTTVSGTPQLAQVMEAYQSFAFQFGFDGFQTFDAIPTGRLSPDEIIDEIDEDLPVLAGISPSGMGEYYPPGMSEHVTLIVGYEVQGNVLWLKVNDPMPYGMFGYDPYIIAGAQPSGLGSYWIPYTTYVQRLGYKDSIIVR